jgi:hypothetical protein
VIADDRNEIIEHDDLPNAWNRSRSMIINVGHLAAEHGARR